MLSIIKPILTEKSAAKMGDSLYVLRVMDEATKTMIVKDLASLYKVEATSVRIVNMPARKVRFRGVRGTQGGFKKAYVQLKKGQELPGFEVKKDDDKKAKKAAKNEEKN
jgi:large subunit ribosomal protein L23